MYTRPTARFRSHLNATAHPDPPERTKLVITLGAVVLAGVSVALVVAAGVLGAFSGQVGR